MHMLTTQSECLWVKPEFSTVTHELLFSCAILSHTSVVALHMNIFNSCYLWQHKCSLFGVCCSGSMEQCINIKAPYLSVNPRYTGVDVQGKTQLSVLMIPCWLAVCQTHTQIFSKLILPRLYSVNMAACI